MKTYLFYDLETSGLNVVFDQILQFAAIRTDEDFHEIERMEYFFNLRADVLPSPRALLVNHLQWSLLEKGISEYEGALKIFKAFNTPETVSVGYNNLSFDDEFLRFTFYRNLLDPYQHQYAHRCYRIDIFPMVLFYYLYLPDKLKWTSDKPVKLENLVIANQLNVSRASHDALADVEATIAIAKRLKTDAQRWRYLEESFCKEQEETRIWKRKGKEGLTGWFISGEFGYQTAFLKPGYYLGQHSHYRNQSIWLPLDLPLEKVMAFEQIYPIRKRYGEPPFWLPLNERYGELSATIVNNLQWIQTHPTWLEQAQDYYLALKYPVVPDLSVEAALYQNRFWSNLEKQGLLAFHRMERLDDKVHFVKKVANQNIQTLGQHLLYRNYAPLLKGELKQQSDDYFRAIWNATIARMNYRNQPYYTVETWQQAFEQLSPLEQQALQNLSKWVEQQKQTYRI